MRKNNKMNDEIDYDITRVFVLTIYVTIELTKTYSRQRTWPFLMFSQQKIVYRSRENEHCKPKNYDLKLDKKSYYLRLYLQNMKFISKKSKRIVEIHISMYKRAFTSKNKNLFNFNTHQGGRLDRLTLPCKTTIYLSNEICMKRAAVIILVLYERVLECSTGKEKRGNFFTVFFYQIPFLCV